MVIEEAAQQVISSVQGLMATISILVGGVFGIYVVLLILRWREYKMMRKIMTEIKNDLKSIRKHFEDERV